jgi:hypothetical protein
MFRRLKRSDQSAGESREGDRLEHLRCSFCLKAQADVRNLIAGPAVYICDECVSVCVDIIADDQRLRIRRNVALRDEATESSNTHEHAQDATPCTLCGEPGSLPAMLLIAGRGALCGACADAVDDALGQGRPGIWRPNDDEEGGNIG